MSTPNKSHNPGFLALVNEAKAHVKEVDIAAYQRMPPEGHILIDVREDREWANGHAAGAVHLSKGVIERDIESEIPDKSRTMVLYCGGGYRSALAAAQLQKNGLQQRHFPRRRLAAAWNQAGLPVEKP